MYPSPSIPLECIGLVELQILLSPSVYYSFYSEIVQSAMPQLAILLSWLRKPCQGVLRFGIPGIENMKL